MRRYLSTIFLLFLIVPCFHGASQGNSLDYAIYLLKNTNISSDSNLDLNKIEMEEKPIITLDNIIEYNWTTHFMKIRKNELLDMRQEDIDVGRIFVLVVRGERIYYGGFWSYARTSGMNHFEKNKFIHIFEPQSENPWLCVEDFHIYDFNENCRLVEILGNSSMLNDKRIYEVLKEHNKLIE